MPTTCLLVEQNDDLTYLIQRYGQEAGIRIIPASSLEAAERAREEQPAAVLLDADLPAQRGWEVLHALKADDRTRRIPVVMYAGMDQRARMLAEGVDEYLQLPFLRKDFLAALAAVGAQGEPAGPAGSVAL